MVSLGVPAFDVARPAHAVDAGWHALAGALELIAGIVTLANPNIGYATLAVLVGIGFILNGIGLTGLDWGIREIRRAVG